MERRGLVVIANDADGAGCGCSLMGAGILVVGAGLALEPWRMVLLGGAALAILLGLGALAAERARARRWRGFALSSGGAAMATARDDRVAVGPMAPPRDGAPKIVVSLDVTPDAQALTLSFVAYCEGDKVVWAARGGAYRIGPIGGELRELPRRLADAEAIAGPLRAARPDLTVSVVG